MPEHVRKKKKGKKVSRKRSEQNGFIFPDVYFLRAGTVTFERERETICPLIYYRVVRMDGQCDS